jgi:ABC-type microcin C transport system duplicated ATPase subunit YejF
MKSIRGNEISMIFQEPMKSFNPIFTIGSQLGETTMKHLGLSKDKQENELSNFLIKFIIPEPSKKVDDYPFQMSGGYASKSNDSISIIL